MGDFAINVAVGHQIGAARGERSILSAMDIREEELFAAFGQSINHLILSHRKDLERKRQTAVTAWGPKGHWFQARGSASEPKNRWVDGTPEYSLFICGLRKLFPGSQFVHICRDVRAVVRSMLNFHRVAGTRLVSNEEKAYDYWFRTVSACVEAEQAYGPGVIHRIRYADLLSNPELAMHSLLDFLEEPYTPKCLEPLKQRINSSDVGDDFVASDPAPDSALVEKATNLSAELETTAQSSERSNAAADALEAQFRRRTQYVAVLDKSHEEAQRLIRALKKQNRDMTEAFDHA
jgi:Sulfotransferase family